MIETGLWFLTAVSWVYWLVAWLCARRFFREEEERAQRRPSGGRSPVSVLKPVRGVDAAAYDNFASFCRQDYPEYEVLFGVADRTDPAAALVRRLQREVPQAKIRLVVVPEQRANPKSSILCGLVREARHETLVISDSDVHVESDYLEEVTAPLDDPEVGAVTCPYRSLDGTNLPARLGALYLNTAFLPEAIAAGTFIGMSFALGATIALRRADLQRAGGFEAIADLLADDYHLGARIAGLGLKVVLSHHVVTHVLGPASCRDQWDREVRWARNIRSLRPWQYAGLLGTFSITMAATLAGFTGASAAGLAALAVSLLLRWLVAASMLRYLRCPRPWSDLLWLPVRDVLTAIVWGWGWMGWTVRWRGRPYLLFPDNRLRPDRRTRLVRRVATWAVRRLDRALRRRQGIYEFTSEEDCVLRLSLGQADYDLELTDGTRIAPTETIGELHFWNEHMPPVPPEGPGLAWGLAFIRRLSQSLRELARHVENDVRMRHVRAFRGRLPWVSRSGPRAEETVYRRCGVEVVAPSAADGFLSRLRAWGELMYLQMLVWTFNPGSLQGLRIGPNRGEVWISRAALLERFGSRAVQPADRAAVRETAPQESIGTNP